MKEVAHLKLQMKTEARPGWNYLLQKGVFLESPSGRNIHQFLTETLGFEDEFIERSVRTIFLNSSPVDDIDCANIHDGDKIALGSAMPGLVGIVMGRDNPYKSFREDISCESDDVEDDADKIKVSLKIFSTLAVESGEGVLKRGIEVEREQLALFLDKHKANIVTSDGLKSLDGKDERVFVRVEFVD